MNQRSRILPAGTGWRIRETLGQLRLLETLRPRRFQAYGCGAAKTGTHSICNIFRRRYRAAHEIDIKRTVELATAYLEGSIPDREIGPLLRRRDWRYWLEMDSSLLNGFLIAPLIRTFPNARFILTVRDPMSWADSLMNHEINRGRPEYWFRFDDLVWEVERFGYTPHDSVLEARGIRPLAAYFNLWARQNREVLNSTPRDQLLILRTEDIPNRLADIAAHVGVPVDTLDAMSASSYAAPQKHALLAKLDPDYVRETEEVYCGELMKVLFPERRSKRPDKRGEREA
ncbi:MAG: sulfotransferase [Alphaproteobacteria bacterium]|nr:sulfotransferase [Alphaproteobacteria bacterium]